MMAVMLVVVVPVHMRMIVLMNMKMLAPLVTLRMCTYMRTVRGTQYISVRVPRPITMRVEMLEGG